MTLKCPEFRVGFSDILLQRPPPVYIDAWIRNCLCAAEGGIIPVRTAVRVFLTSL